MHPTTPRRATRRALLAALLAMTAVLGTLVTAPVDPVAAQEEPPPPPGPAEEQDPEPAAYDRLSPSYVGAPWFQPGRRYDANFPDPTILWDGSRYWAYATSTGGPKLPVMWSTDLETWTARDAYSPNPYNGDRNFNDAFPVPPSWSFGGSSNVDQAQWAPGIARIGDSYVLYSSWEVSPGRRCLSAARSSSPAGPFVDHADRPIWCDGDPAGSIDAEPFVDHDGTPYLLWKSEGVPGKAPTRLWARQLSPDGLSLLPGSEAKVLLSTAGGWEGWVIENPSMFAAGGAYWLVYSGNEWASGDYRMGQARCSSPLGPCTRTSSGPLFGNTDEELGPGGGSVFQDATGRLRLAYHSWNAPFTSYPDDPNCDGGGHCTSQGQRRLRIDGLVALPGSLTVSPFGFFDQVAVSRDAIHVTGWAIDPSDPSPIEVHLYVDGVGVAATLASVGRPDVAAAFPGLGSAHGYSLSVPSDGGVHQVCAYGLDVGAGDNALLGCRTVTVPTGPPFGTIDTVVPGPGPGAVSVSGWAIDPDVADPLEVHVYVDGKGTALTADGERPDVGGAFPDYGAEHGFWTTVPASGGHHDVCVWAINQEAGANALLGCRAVTVPTGPPFGVIDVVDGGPGTLSVTGWAIDPDSAASLDVHVYVDGVGVATTARGIRPDVAAAFPGYGAGHGFSTTVPATPGAHEVCVYAINRGAGGNALLGCRTGVVPGGSPFGSLDRVAAGPGEVSVQGWAIDPDVAAPIEVHVYVGPVGAALTASGSRPDVGAAFPGYGAGHGFSTTVPAAPGVHQVCAWAIDVGVGANALLGCRTVTVP